MVASFTFTPVLEGQCVELTRSTLETNTVNTISPLAHQPYKVTQMYGLAVYVKFYLIICETCLSYGIVFDHISIWQIQRI